MTDFVQVITKAIAQQQNQFTLAQILEEQMKEAGELARMIYEQQTSAPGTLKKRSFGVEGA